MQIAKPAMKSDKKSIVQDSNNFNINNPEIKLEEDSFYKQDLITSYKSSLPKVVQDNLNTSEIKQKEDSIFKHNTPRYNETRSLNNVTHNNTEVNNHNIKEKIVTPVHKMKSNYTEASHDGVERNDQRNISTEHRQDSTNDTKISIIEDQLMVESIQKYMAIPVIVQHGVIVPYVLQQTLPQEIISLDFKNEFNQPSLTNSDKEDMTIQDILLQKLPQEVINREFKNVNQLTQINEDLTHYDREIRHKEETQSRVDSERIQQNISQEIKDADQPNKILTIQNIPPNLQENTPQKTDNTTPILQEKMLLEPQTTTPNMQETVSLDHQNMQPKAQENIPQKTANRIVKRQKRFISLFKRNEEQESDNFLFKMLEFLLKNRRTVVPVFTVMREINTLVKSTSGELNHMSKERNNYIGAPPPVLTPVTYNLELGNENRAMAFIKRLLGLTPKGDRLNISGTGK